MGNCISCNNNEITVLTGNPGKLKEFQSIIGDSVIIKNERLDLEEIQTTYCKKVVEDKLNRAIDVLKGKSCIVDDSGLEINDKVMNGFPGALIKFYYDKLGNEGICQRNGGLNATAVTVIGYYDGKNKYYFEGKRKGKIAKKPQSNGEGFGWDPVFIPEMEGNQINELSYAQLSEDVKNKISQRSAAIEKLKEHIIKNKN